MQKNKISCEEIISIIPNELISRIGKEMNIDYSVSKLTGKNMFSLLLWGLISEKELSLSILEDIYQSPGLQKLTKGEKINKSSIGHRLSKMNSEYFKQIFDHLSESKAVDKYMGNTRKKYLMKKIDSTIVNLSSKLLSEGMKVHKTKRDLKYSVALMNSIPTDIKIFTKQTYASENKALKEIIDSTREKENNKTTILVFDKGINSRDILDEIHEQKSTFFVTRKGVQGCKVDGIYKKIKGRKAGKLILQKDEIVHFESTREKRDKSYRLVSAIDPKTKTKYQFLTDIFFLNAVEICKIYKGRWEIESFFKFIKQQLNFSHLVSRNMNGIKIMMYMTMIAAIFIAIYKKINKISTWGSAKRHFIWELEAHVLEIFFPYYADKWGYSKNLSHI